MSADINNLPYWSSVPLVLTTRISAPLQGGFYTFDGRPVSMAPTAHLDNTALYVITEISFAFDINQLDFQAAVRQVPEINFYSTGEARTPLVRKPIIAPIYYDGYNYIYAFESKKTPSEVLASLRARVEQTPALIGVGVLTGTIILKMYEVVDDAYISEFKAMGKPGAIPQHSIFKGRNAGKTLNPSGHLRG